MGKKQRKKVFRYRTLVLLSALSMAAVAQTEEDEAIGFVNTTYFFFDTGARFLPGRATNS
jgi:Skp family chaperone for outer membrane proteins